MSAPPHSRRSLTLPMMRTLRAIRQQPGGVSNEYGTKGTVDALIRRKLIHVFTNGQVEPTKLGAQIHLHEFRRTLHLDGCHYFTDAGSCDCGATYRSYIERDLKSDPYSAFWMEPTGGEDCQRCDELKDGAKPRVIEQIDESRARAA
jgi:hypothetical protein